MKFTEPGNDVSEVGNDASEVGNDVSEVGDKLSEVGDELSGRRDGVSEGEDELSCMGKGAFRVGIGVAVVGEGGAVLGNHDPHMGNDGGDVSHFGYARGSKCGDVRPAGPGCPAWPAIFRAEMGGTCRSGDGAARVHERRRTERRKAGLWGCLPFCMGRIPVPFREDSPVCRVEKWARGLVGGDRNFHSHREELVRARFPTCLDE